MRLCNIYVFFGVCFLQQYWNTDKGKYKYVPATAFADSFKQTAIAQSNMQYLEEPYVAPNTKCDEALITHKYALSGQFFLHLSTACLPSLYLKRSACLHMHRSVSTYLHE